ncbi:ribosome hibernation-promoting factor, HPF/YfiA family [Marasmitruncus massiliensis]|jgi:putative sigma-54 modulation protein|uniref:ribosome hibernation-promoting factor, HPF/YfiA family n=1 Tax=Marasmitruncus massiliensis TaxID=1944642 RepID=UPI000C7CDA1A|nr:ribosome-associated translation inhibitor RaiA [Marasmitruncus massiliensis]MBE6905622.1 ribosome-associated translation inhibitor RaiA [Oscillospiraceae bacterium]
MNITITARKTSVRDSFKERIDRKLSKLDRFFDEGASATVTVTNEGDRDTVEVTIQSRGMYYRAEKTTSDRFDSLEAVVDNLFRQIVKNKNKLGKRLRDTAFAPANLEAGEEQEHQTGEYDIERVKRFVMRPMDVNEAILQMNLLEHEFFIFLNAETNETNVVYKRHNGTYGVLEPTVG